MEKIGLEFIESIVNSQTLESQLNVDAEIGRIETILKERNYPNSILIAFAARMCFSSKAYEYLHNEMFAVYTKEESFFKTLFSENNGNEREKEFFEFIELTKKVAVTQGVLMERQLRPKYLANRRLKNDPIQLAKKEIEKCYEASKSQFKRRGYSAQFIREMHTKYPIIQSHKTIEKLVAALNSENDHIPR